MSALWPYLILFIESSCLLVSLFCLQREREQPWRFMPWYLAVVVATEWTGYFMQRQQLPNGWLYNVYLLVEGSFTGYFLYCLCLPYKDLRKHLIGFLSLFFLSFVVELVLRKNPESFNHYTATLMGLCMLTACLYYFKRIYYNTTIYRMHTFAGFYWVSGVFFFYAGTLFSDLMFDVLIVTPLKIGNASLSFYFFVVVNLISYNLWIISLFLRRFNVRSSG